MDYNARFYDPMLGRFTSPDSIIPDPDSVIGYNRFAYVNNNPIIYTDPSGHALIKDDDETGTPITDVYNTPAHRITMDEVIKNRIASLGVGDSCSVPMNCLSKDDFTYTNPSIQKSIETKEEKSGLDLYYEDRPNQILSENSGIYSTTNENDPDYNSYTVNWTFLTVVYTIDRWDQKFIGFGGNIGKAYPITFSVNNGNISVFHDYLPGPDNTNDYISGLAVNFGAGALIDGAITWSPFAGDENKHWGDEYGALVPYGIGVSATYNFNVTKLYDFFVGDYFD